MKQAREIVENVNQIVDDINIFSDIPSITRIYPTVVGPAEEREFVVVTIRGLNIDESDPKLFFGGEETHRIKLERQEAVFNVPASLLQHKENEVDIVSGKIQFLTEKCKLWVVWCDDKILEYETAVFTLPEKLGDISFEYNTREEKRIYSDKTFSKEFSKTTGDLTRYRCSKYNQGPHAANYFIDTNTIKPTAYSKSCPNNGLFAIVGLCKNGKMNMSGTRGRAGHNWKFLGKSPAGYSLELCAKSQIRKLSKRTGEMHVNLSWKEYVLDDVVSPKANIESEPVLNWNTGRVVDFPNNAHAISSKIRFFDGTEIAFTGSYSNEYVDILWNAATKQLQINTKKPSSIEEIY